MDIQLIDPQKILCKYPKEQLIICYLALEKLDVNKLYLGISLNSHSDVAKMLRSRVKKPYEVIDGGFFIVEENNIIIKYESIGNLVSGDFDRNILRHYLLEMGFQVIVNPDYEFDFC